MTGFDPVTGMPTFAGASQGDRNNDSVFTNRFRLNMRVKATENLEFKGRLAMYKAWGMQTTPTGLGDGANRGRSYPIFDGNVTRQPNDSALYVDRAFLNWNNIGGWAQVRRRIQLRLPVLGFFAPGNDDLYQPKLATRGNAYEMYLIYDLPTGEAISRYAKTFIRLGWQYYDYNFAGGFDWNMKPYDLNDDKAQLQALGINPAESANQVYLTFEAYF